jgi:molecular chaperone GrpE
LKLIDKHAMFGQFARASRPTLRHIVARTAVHSRIVTQRPSLVSRRSQGSLVRWFSTEQAREHNTEQGTSEPAETEEAVASPKAEDEVEDAGPVDPNDAEIAALQTRLTQSDALLKEAQEKVVRSLADMENTRHIARTDVANARKFGVQGFAKSILEAADNFELALAAAKDGAEAGDNEDLNSFYEGMMMTHKTLLKGMEKHGVVRFESLGEKFDPNLHDGLFQVEDPTKEPNTVGQVLKSGYTLNERVLRPAQVGTVKKPAEPQPEPAPE